MTGDKPSHNGYGPNGGRNGGSDSPDAEIGIPVVADGPALYRITSDSGVLDVNSSYAYLMWCRDFAGTSVVAREDGEAVGFITGYLRPDAPDVLMVWQVAVDASQRGRGLAGKLLTHLVDRLVPRGVRYLETTITADNTASIKLFSALARDPVAACMVASRVEAAGLRPSRLGGEVWGYGSGLDGLCFSGVNLIPLAGSPEAMRAFADRVLRRRRVCSSLVGPSEQVLALWDELAGQWGPAREVREQQPLMVLSGPPLVRPDPLVRQVRPEELDRYLPAAVAMFTEEVGVDPSRDGGAAGYRARVAELIAAGRAFARFDGGEVVFKAEIGAMSRSVGQIQGVWVHPDRRSSGLGTAGTAAIADRLVRGLGRTASLYVNGFNVSARVAYGKVGFHQLGTFSTVLF